MSPLKDTKVNPLLNFLEWAECTWKRSKSLLQVPGPFDPQSSALTPYLPLSNHWLGEPVEIDNAL